MNHKINDYRPQSKRLVQKTAKKSLLRTVRRGLLLHNDADNLLYALRFLHKNTLHTELYQNWYEGLAYLPGFVLRASGLEAPSLRRLLALRRKTGAAKRFTGSFRDALRIPLNNGPKMKEGKSPLSFLAYLPGFEPGTYRVGVCHSIQLSYRYPRRLL